MGWIIITKITAPCVYITLITAPCKQKLKHHQKLKSSCMGNSRVYGSAAVLMLVQTQPQDINIYDMHVWLPYFGN